MVALRLEQLENIPPVMKRHRRFVSVSQPHPLVNDGDSQVPWHFGVHDVDSSRPIA